MQIATTVSLSECLRALAFMGDLGVDQPADAALRTASLGFTLARGAGPQAVPLTIIATLAREIEAISRQHGIAAALALIAGKRASFYPAPLMDMLGGHAAEWLADLDARTLCRRGLTLAERPNDIVPLELIADLIDLQQPWLRGHSRRVAQAAAFAARVIGLDFDAQLRSYRAALIHGLGRGAVSSALWNWTGTFSVTQTETMRLAPYWTMRALSEVDGLADAAEVASYVGERLDGSGHFRGCRAAAIPIEGQVLAAASAWVALQSARPWRPAHAADDANRLLGQEAGAGRFHAGLVNALCGMQPAAPAASSTPARIRLSEREATILRAISQGHTNKEVARQLIISPSTVGTHVESAFRKLGCSTRAAAVLKAQALRLI